MSAKAQAPNTSRWTVRKYLDEIYVPQKQLSVGLTNGTAEFYRHSLRMLNDCVGRDVKLREVDAAMLDQLEAWSLREGCSKRTAKARRHAIMGVVRHWRPEAFPKNSPFHQPNLQFLEADVVESLEHVCLNRYFPENPKIAAHGTITQYGRCLRCFSEFLGATATLADLTDENIGRYMRYRVDVGKVKAVTVNGEAKQLKALWNWAAKKRLVDKFPTIGKLPEAEVIPRAWTKLQLAILMRSINAAEGTIEGIPASAYWRALHLVLWDTGERTGAMLGLKWDMLDFKTGVLSVPAEIRKGKRKAMVYWLKPQTVDALRSIILPSRVMIFGGGKRHVFHKMYKRLILASGLNYEVRKSGPQKMRRTFASYITAAGGDATKALRHSTTRVTEESYNDPTIANPTPPNSVLFDLDAANTKGGEA